MYVFSICKESQKTIERSSFLYSIFNRKWWTYNKLKVLSISYCSIPLPLDTKYAFNLKIKIFPILDKYHLSIKRYCRVLHTKFTFTAVSKFILNISENGMPKKLHNSLRSELLLINPSVLIHTDIKQLIPATTDISQNYISSSNVILLCSHTKTTTNKKRTICLYPIPSLTNSRKTYIVLCDASLIKQLAAVNNTTFIEWYNHAHMTLTFHSFHIIWFVCDRHSQPSVN